MNHLVAERARRRAIGSRSRLLSKEGGSVTATELAAILGIATETISDWRPRGSVLGVETEAGDGILYPVWQVHEGQLLPDLALILSEIDEVARTSISKVIFFLTHSKSLGGVSPLELMRRGDPESLARVHAFALVFGRC